MKDAIAQQLLIQTHEAKNTKAAAYNLKLILPPASQVSQTVFRHWQFASLQYTNGEEKGEGEREKKYPDNQYHFICYTTPSST